MRRLVFLFLLPSCAGSAVNDPEESGVVEATFRTIQFTANDTVLIELDTGQSAVVTFSPVTNDAFTYRWKYRASSKSRITTGGGRLQERYRHVAWRWDWTWPPWDCLYEEVAPLPDNVTTVRAGEINVEWFARALGEGYLYYDPDHVTIRLFPIEAFEAWP